MTITADQKKTYIKWGVIGAVILAVIITALSIYGTINNARGGAITRENAIVAQYNDNKNELSKNILIINETLGIADRQSEVLNGILADAVQGRYDGDLQPGTGGTMFSAIAEAYPDLTATTESYAKVQDAITSQRESFKKQQSKLLDMIQNYKTWTTADIFRSWVLNTFVGTPTDLMVIEHNGETLRGQAALDQASKIITTSDAEEAYNTGTQEPIIKPKGDDSAE